MSALPLTLIPPNEVARLQSLRHYHILPSLHEAVFDKLVGLAACIFSVPISLISLVEEEDVFYKASYGMPGNMVYSRQEALCATAIMQDSAVVYQDLATETNPLITARAAQAARASQLRFYAAAPLRMPGHYLIGALCIIDHQPRTLSSDERQVLEQLGALVSQTIVVRHACLGQPEGEAQWQWLRQQVQEEVQALTALVRYLFARHGTKVPVPADSLAQVARRLLDLGDVLSQNQG